MSRYFFTSPSHGVDVEVDLASQVLELEVTDLGPSEAPMRPTLPGLDADWEWAPAMAFALKAKAFDDGLYAAVDLLVQDGTPLLPGKRHLLERVHRVLRARWQPTSQDPLKSALVLVQTWSCPPGSPIRSRSPPWTRTVDTGASCRPRSRTRGCW